MHIMSPRVLAISFVVCLGVGVAGGLVFALLADRVVAHGIGTGLLVVGIVALWMALLGATEPPEGWARRGRRGPGDGRRSVVARLAADRADLEQEVSSLSLVVWGVAVGGSMIGLSLLAFYVAQ
jgi:hypothetical protein